MSYEHVIAAVEPNDEAAVVVRRARALAGRNPISLVSAVPVPVHHYGPAWTMDATGIGVAMMERAREHANEYLHALAKDEGVPADRVHIRSGHAASVLHEVAAEIEADCIVLGCHGQHGLSLFFGSTANQLVHGLECDAYFVRVGDGSGERSGQILCAVDGNDEDSDRVT